VVTTKILPDFLAFAVNSQIGRTQIDALSRQIIGQANVNTDELRSLQIPLPPLTVQHAIMQRVEEGRAAISQERKNARRLAAVVKQEIEEMILGTRTAPEANGRLKVST
jgi:type I restriction enzyme S subunit